MERQDVASFVSQIYVNTKHSSKKCQKMFFLCLHKHIYNGQNIKN